MILDKSLQFGHVRHSQSQGEAPPDLDSIESQDVPACTEHVYCLHQLMPRVTAGTLAKVDASAIILLVVAVPMVEVMGLLRTIVLGAMLSSHAAVSRQEASAEGLWLDPLLKSCRHGYIRRCMALTNGWVRMSRVICRLWSLRVGKRRTIAALARTLKFEYCS